MTIEQAREILKLPAETSDDFVQKIIDITRALARIYIEHKNTQSGIIKK